MSKTSHAIINSGVIGIVALLLVRTGDTKLGLKGAAVVALVNGVLYGWFTLLLCGVIHLHVYHTLPAIGWGFSLLFGIALDVIHFIPNDPNAKWWEV